MNSSSTTGYRPLHPRSRRLRSSGRRRITPRFFWMSVLVLFLTYLSYGYVTGFIKMTQLQRAIRDIEQQAAAFEIRNEQLRQQLARLESDAYIERVARQQLGLVMPGEQSYVVITEDAGD